MERRERSDECRQMTYSGRRQHQQPTSDDKASADCARHEMPADGFLHEHKRRNSCNPEHVHHATNEQQRHQHPTASNTKSAVPDPELQSPQDIPAKTAVGSEKELGVLAMR